MSELKLFIFTSYFYEYKKYRNRENAIYSKYMIMTAEAMSNNNLRNYRLDKVKKKIIC